MNGEAHSPAPSATLSVTVHGAAGVSMVLPAVIARSGERAARTTLEFFTARIPNAHTRRAYGRAVFAFCAWCERENVSLERQDAPTVSVYLAGLGVSTASVKLTASVLRHWLDFLTERRVLPQNPAISVRTERLVVTEGKTPVLERDEARALFASRDAAAATGDILALRAYPLPSRYAGYLQTYVATAGFEPRRRVPLFQSAPGRKPALSGKPMTGGKVWDAVKRRCREAGLPASISNHSFRATGITIHRENKGRLEDAQALAGHADARTTRLYVRAERKIAQAEVERVQL